MRKIPDNLFVHSRMMTKDDVDRVHCLEQECFSIPWSKAAIASELNNDVAHYRVMERDGMVVAYGGMWVMFTEAHITNVGVAKAYRKQGLGTLILRDMMRAAQQLGATAMTLEVRKSNIAAQTLYKNNGFLLSGIRNGYYEDNGEAALILWNQDIDKTLESLGE